MGGYQRGSDSSPLWNEIIDYNPPLPRLQGNIYLLGMGAGGGGERAPVALCREPVYVATTVGPGRAPPGRRTRAGRRDGGGLPITSPPHRREGGGWHRRPIKSLHKRRSGIFSRSDQPCWVNPLLKSRRAKPRGIFLPRAGTRPAGEAQRDFPGPSGHGRIFLACGANRPALRRGRRRGERGRCPGCSPGRTGPAAPG